MEKRYIFEFVKPLKTTEPWNRWHLTVGGWEMSGSSEEELKKIAMDLLEKELVRLKKKDRK